MFICEVTGQSSALGEKLTKVVVGKREKIYYEEHYNEELRQWQKVQVGKGWEITKELNACEDGVKVFKARQEYEALVGPQKK